MNCKSGDLAIVISTIPKHLDAIGRIVNVISWDEPTGEWGIQFVGTTPVSCARYKFLTANDSDLRPVSGLPEAEETGTERPIKEAA